jgi:carbamoyl-phosphate synthase small subunit
MFDDSDSLPSSPNAALLLADGTIFYGVALGAPGPVYGEICFNTAMTGYQEVLTDPSYQGQVITFTFPHIGNVGCNPDDIESHEARVMGACGVVLREPVTEPSNFRAGLPLNIWMEKRGITGICGIDTRALTHYIRTKGAQNVAIVTAEPANLADALEKAKTMLAGHPSLDGMELAQGVTTKESYGWETPRWALSPQSQLPASYHVVAIDYGEKLNILRSLASVGCKVTVVPAQMPAAEILALKPDGVFLSNGPGDPAATGGYSVAIIRDLIDSGLPVFGICLGHQMLALALGAKTEKMHQGHRGANHPVKNLANGKVEITSQNHGFVVREDSLPENVEVTHRSLFDGSIEGIRLKGKPVFSVQYHPESSPGPHDSYYLFEEFVSMIKIQAVHA